MLTKSDLEQMQGAVREVVKTEIATQLESTEKRLRGAVRDEVRLEVGAAGKRLGEVVRGELKGVEKRLNRKLRKMQNSLVQYHDECAIYLRQRIEKLKEHTGLVKPNKN